MPVIKPNIRIPAMQLKPGRIPAKSPPAMPGINGIKARMADTAKMDRLLSMMSIRSAIIFWDSTWQPAQKPERMKSPVNRIFSWKKTSKERPFQEMHNTPIMHNRMQKSFLGGSFSLNRRTLDMVRKTV